MLGLVLGIGLVLGLAMLLGLANFNLSHEHPAEARIPGPHFTHNRASVQ